MARGARWTLMTALCLGAAQANADVTAAEVWASMRALGAQAGNVTETADGITLTDMTVTPRKATAIGFQTATAERVILRNIDGGRVEIRPEGRIMWRATAKGKVGDRIDTLETVATLTEPGGRAIVSGTRDRMLGAAEIPQFTLDATTTAPASPKPVVTVHAEARGLNLTGVPMAAAPGPVEMTAKAEALSVTFDDTRDAAPANGTVQLEGLSLSGNLDIPNPDPGGPFLGATVLSSMVFGRLALDLSMPQTATAARPVVLHGEARDFSFELDGKAKAVAAEGDIPETDGTAGLKVGRYSYAFTGGTDAAGGGADTGTARGSGEGLDLAATVKVPGLVKDASLGAAFAAGLAIQVRGSSGATDQSVSFGGPGDAGRVLSHDAGGQLEFSMSRDGLIMSASQQAAQISAAGPMLPGEVGLSFSAIALRLAGPVSPGADAQPWALALRLEDLKLSDAVWNLFDPDGKIDRSPAGLVTEMSGTAHVTRDPFADETAGDVPYRPDTLDLTQLRMRLGGADLEGGGTLTFRDKAGQPIPEGKLHFTLKGIYGLLEDLGTVAAVPSEALLVFRGGLGMVTKAVGKDDLVSEIEFRPDGSIWANGTRMPLP